MKRSALLAVLVATAMGAAACSGDAEAPSQQGVSDRPSLGRDPLQLPTVDPAEPCPTSPRRATSPDFGPGLGDGPAYPVGFTADGKLYVELPPFEPAHQWSGSGWGGRKVLWVVDPAYTGPIRIRGGRLDAAGEIRFDNELVSELKLSAGGDVGLTASGWRHRPSHTRVQAPGCYAYRVDGEGFSDVIVFEALPLREACTARRVRRLVNAFVDAFNRGNARGLDLAFAVEPEFRWYSTDGPGARLEAEARDRDTLLNYFARRHRRGERLHLTSFRFHGYSAGYGHFEYVLVRRAHNLPPTDYLGKGAAICTAYEDFIAVWSMGRA